MPPVRFERTVWGRLGLLQWGLRPFHQRNRSWTRSSRSTVGYVLVFLFMFYFHFSLPWHKTDIVFNVAVESRWTRKEAGTSELHNRFEPDWPYGMSYTALFPLPHVVPDHSPLFLSMRWWYTRFLMLSLKSRTTWTLPWLSAVLAARVSAALAPWTSTAKTPLLACAESTGLRTRIPRSTLFPIVRIFLLAYLSTKERSRVC